ncbi:orotidine-5'-phosphate decarboxylase [Phytoactinopolyspora endophytica]|uniref:orotidine-5'-phosphate decarboxylase n=1 Tax=Phytoactinopolyspora endophytica TaxID=1642495 RepID=UPI001F107227|nr:orotidine-5'-phosphate decarboxylase [Phytoactinopolyspora endophytica]
MTEQRGDGVTFGSRLFEAMRDRGPLCVGIDPHASLLREWGLGDDVAGLERFCRTVVDALAGDVAIFKPQSAFFERHGSRGIAVLERLLTELRSAGALVLMDAKRGDIGSTVQAYADAYLDPSSSLCADAVTASPYLGFGSLQPLIDTALAHGNGVFVLARTSNPEGGEVQHACGPDGRTVAETIFDHVRRVNAGERPFGSIGCVVGATGGRAGTDGVDGEKLRVNGPLLAPGIGAQGAQVSDLKGVFGPVLSCVLPSVSREILRCGPDSAALSASAFALNAQVKEMLIEK